MGCDLFPNEALGFKFIHVSSADPKSGPKNFAQANVARSMHHYQSVAEMTACRGKCCWHPDKEHCISRPEPPDLFTVGFPCAPFSSFMKKYSTRKTGSCTARKTVSSKLAITL